MSGLAFASTATLAQTPPDAGSLMRENERSLPQKFPSQLAPQAVPEAPAKPGRDALNVLVKGFRITGNTLIAESELLPVLAPWVGREVTFAELQQAANAIANEYRRRGWFARPQLPAQDVSEGIIRIHVLEGKLGAVRIDDGGQALRIDRNRVTDTMTARQQPGDPLNLDKLERSSNLLNDTPGVAAATILTAGEHPAETDAVVKVQDKPLIAGTVQADNHGSHSTGTDKLTLSLTLDNPSGQGDQIALNSNANKGSLYLKLGYSLPIGHDGLRAGFSVSGLRYELVGPDFEALNSNGDAQTYGVSLNYPLLRTSRRNISLGAAFDLKDYYNEANDVATSEKRIHAGLLAITGDMLDSVGAGGLTLWGLNLTLGNVDLSDNAVNQAADRNGPRSAGRYYKFGANLARLQRLSDKFTLWAAINGQLANKNLDSSEEFSLGGPSGVRAYPVIEGSGDEGLSGTLELRYNLTSAVQFSAFYDYGRIRRDKDADFTGALTPALATLQGYGLGLSWNQAGQYAVRAAVARRIGDNPLRSVATGLDQDGSYDKTRLWLSGTVFF